MKTKIIFLVIFTVCILSLNAQFRVNNGGWVQIGYDNYAPLSLGNSSDDEQWVIESYGNILNFARPYPQTNWGNYKMFIRNDNGNVGIGLSDNNAIGKLHVSTNSTSNGTYGIYAIAPKPASGNYYGRSIAGYITSGGGLAYGVYGSSINSSLQSKGRAYGVLGRAGNATSGYNYGTYGHLYGSGNGAAIYGRVEGESDYAISGKYAGYFRGDVKCEDVLWAYDLQESDIRIKKDIKKLNGSLNNLCKLNAITYKLKTKEEIARDFGMAVSDTGNFISDTSVLNSITHIGLSAQEVQKVFKDLVFEGQDGILGIHYSGLIPVIIESIKELNNNLQLKSDSLQTIQKELEFLKQQVDNLNQQMKKCCTENLKSANGDLSIEIGASNSVLNQNMPNPFTEDTKISMYIDNEVSNAELYIFDVQGKYISSYHISERGNAEVTISGNDLNAGMYLYTLVVDGKEVGTKRMILNE